MGALSACQSQRASEISAYCSESVGMTCGQARDMYKHNGCCGNPKKKFEADDKDGRRLWAVGEESRVERFTRQAMNRAKARGELNRLRNDIMDVLKPFL